MEGSSLSATGDGVTSTALSPAGTRRAQSWEQCRTARGPHSHQACGAAHQHVCRVPSDLDGEQECVCSHTELQVTPMGRRQCVMECQLQPSGDPRVYKRLLEDPLHRLC